MSCTKPADVPTPTPTPVVLTPNVVLTGYYWSGYHLNFTTSNIGNATAYAYISIVAYDYYGYRYSNILGPSVIVAGGISNGYMDYPVLINHWTYSITW